MKLEQQVTSLEISKRLKELGVKQESLFWWGSAIPGAGILKRDSDFSLSSMPVKLNGNWKGFYSAFTVAELGEMLPEGYATYVAPHQKKIPPAKWKCIFPMPHNLEKDVFADTEADARGKMLVYLLENNLLTPTNEDNNK